MCRVAREEYGISIILDGVFSHTGCDSKYFNMYGNYDTVGAYNSKESPYFSWYKFINYPDDYHSWWGIKLLPEIEEENESYRKYICGKDGILRKWLRCGVRGWRLDVADELPDVFLDDLRTAVKAEKKDAVIIGEVLFGKFASKRKLAFAFTLASVILGAVIYYMVYQFVLWLKMPSEDMKLFSAIVVAIFLAIPYLKEKRTLRKGASK